MYDNKIIRNLQTNITKLKIENFKSNAVLNEIELNIFQMSQKLDEHKQTMNSLLNAATHSHLLNQQQEIFSGSDLQLRSNWIAKANQLKLNCQSKSFIVEKALLSSEKSKIQSKLKCDNGRKQEDKLRHSLRNIFKRIEITKDEMNVEEFNNVQFSHHHFIKV